MKKINLMDLDSIRKEELLSLKGGLAVNHVCGCTCSTPGCGDDDDEEQETDSDDDFDKDSSEPCELCCDCMSMTGFKATLKRS